MDFVSSVFQFDQIDELIQFSSIPCQQDTIQEDTLRVTPPLYNGDVIKKADYSPRQKSYIAFDDENPSDYKRKKIIHRDVERQRRLEMAALYRSLKSLLPVENLKGKKTMSDHMDVAVTYISHLQKRVDEMREKRDDLKRSFEDECTSNNRFKCLPSGLEENVTVIESSAGVRVAVSTAMSGGVSVSRVLDLLLCEGLNVVSCISTNVEGRLHHIIESEVGDEMSINPSELRKKLTDLMV